MPARDLLWQCLADVQAKLQDCWHHQSMAVTTARIDTPMTDSQLRSILELHPASVSFRGFSGTLSTGYLEAPLPLPLAGNARLDCTALLAIKAAAVELPLPELERLAGATIGATMEDASKQHLHDWLRIYSLDQQQPLAWSPAEELLYVPASLCRDVQGSLLAAYLALPRAGICKATSSEKGLRSHALQAEALTRRACFVASADESSAEGTHAMSMRLAAAEAEMKSIIASYECRRESRLQMTQLALLAQMQQDAVDHQLTMRSLLLTESERSLRSKSASPGVAETPIAKDFAARKSTPAEMWRDAMAAIESKVQSMPEPQQLLQEMASEQVRSSESLQTAMQREDAHASLSNSDVQEQDLRSAIATPEDEMPAAEDQLHQQQQQLPDATAKASPAEVAAHDEAPTSEDVAHDVKLKARNRREAFAPLAMESKSNFDAAIPDEKAMAMLAPEFNWVMKNATCLPPIFREPGFTPLNTP